MRLPAALLLVLVVACGARAPYIWASQVPPAQAQLPNTLREGDKVQVVVHGQDQMSGEFEVRPGGTVVLPVAGVLLAEGRTPEQLAADVRTRLQGALANPHVMVVVSLRRPAAVSVVGEVRTPGRYEISDEEGVLHAIARAGGLTPFADEDGIYVVRKDAGPRIRFRYGDLTAANPSSIGFRLRSGDVVVVE